MRTDVLHDLRTQRFFNNWRFYAFMFDHVIADQIQNGAGYAWNRYFFGFIVCLTNKNKSVKS
jgi:hypothetical protein